MRDWLLQSERLCWEIWNWWKSDRRESSSDQGLAACGPLGSTKPRSWAKAAGCDRLAFWWCCHWLRSTDIEGCVFTPHINTTSCHDCAPEIWKEKMLEGKIKVIMKSKLILFTFLIYSCSYCERFVSACYSKVYIWLHSLSSNCINFHHLWKNFPSK